MAFDRSELAPCPVEAKLQADCEAAPKDHRELVELFTDLVAKFEEKVQPAQGAGSFKDSQPHIQEAALIRQQIDKTRVAIKEAREHFNDAIDASRAEMVTKIQRLSNAGRSKAGTKLLTNICGDFLKTPKADRVARASAFKLVTMTLGSVSDSLGPK
jgi:hypothetical protein